MELHVAAHHPPVGRQAFPTAFRAFIIFAGRISAAEAQQQNHKQPIHPHFFFFCLTHNNKHRHTAAAFGERSLGNKQDTGWLIERQQLCYKTWTPDKKETFARMLFGSTDPSSSISRKAFPSLHSHRGVLLCLAHDSFRIPFPSWRFPPNSPKKSTKSKSALGFLWLLDNLSGSCWELLFVAHSVDPSVVFSTAGGCSHPRLCARTSGNAAGGIIFTFPDTLNTLLDQITKAKPSPSKKMC